MRKIVLTTLAALMLSGGAAFAQGSWAGISLGWPVLQGYYGMQNALGENLDLRARLGIHPIFGIAVNVGADALYQIQSFGDANEFDLYAGGGPSVGFITAAGVGGFTFDLTGLVGIEYNLNETTGIFGETRLGVGYVSVAGFGGVAPAYGGALGANFYF